MVIVVTPRKE
ncbi:Hypothetical protein SSCIU_00664 [Mammaliicoccus sciuri]|nr:Hypothetical protein SSCIU_00664 [Mammaliicoccus sciuri]